MPGFFGDRVSIQFNLGKLVFVTSFINVSIVPNQCLQECDEGLFGPGCRNNCTCENGARCDAVTGSCRCLEGWTGRDCEERACPVGKFGANCSQTCLCNADNTELCHPRTGACSCKAGWDGTMCSRPCPLLRYGPQCLGELYIFLVCKFIICNISNRAYYVGLIANKG
jgi:hypothetical protein